MFLDLLGELLRGEEGGMYGNSERERRREGGRERGRKEKNVNFMSDT